MVVKLLSVALFVSFILHFGASAEVVDLGKSFQDAVMDKNDVWLVLFSDRLTSFINHDGPNTNPNVIRISSTPDFDKVASKMSTYGIQVGRFDCSESK